MTYGNLADPYPDQLAIAEQRIRDQDRIIAHLRVVNGEQDQRIAELEKRTAVCMGVGDGSGQLFVYGDYDSIKAAQAGVFRREAAEARIAELEGDLREIAECDPIDLALDPEWPQRIARARLRVAQHNEERET
jgi:hypothetical protein